MANRLQEIKDEMEALIEEAKFIIRLECSRHTYDRAKAYWLTSMEHALNPLYAHDASINEAISELEDKEQDEEDEEDNEDCDMREVHITNPSLE